MDNDPKPPASLFWSPGDLWRYAALGPVSGAMIGAVHTLTAMCNWMYYNEPDFYFRGWSGVEVHFAILAIGGVVAGVPFAFAIMCLETFTLRRVIVWKAMLWMFLFSLIVFATVSHIEIRDRILPSLWWPIGVAIIGSFIGSAGLLGPRPNSSPHNP